MAPYDGFARWIGQPLRMSFGASANDGLPDDLVSLIEQIDGHVMIQTFASDLAALMPRLRAYARSLSRETDTAEDLVQDTLLRAWKSRDQFVPGTSLRAWTFTILRNVFLSQRRRARFAAEYDEVDAERRLATAETQTVCVQLAQVERAMALLRDDQREALRLVAIEGLSYDAAAQAACISPASLKSRVWRARVMLQSIIDGERPDLKPVAPRSPKLPPSPPSGPTLSWADAKASGQTYWIG